MQEVPRSLEILATLCRHPATSYFEDKVAREVERILADAAIPWEQDEFGNIIARLTRRDTSDPTPPRPIALVAHMDHPGFEIVEVDGRRLTLQMRGRVSDVIYDQQVDLVVHCADGSSCAARTTGQDGDMQTRILYADLAEQNELVLPAFAVFDLVDCEFRNNRVFARALDDLAGCAATLSVLETLAAENEPVDVFGVLTRAEEDGLIGARLLAANGSLPKETLVISVESSRTLPGAEQENGPVIRVGDAISTFSQSAEVILQDARTVLQRRDPPIPVQRQLMSGGVCEASVFVAHGYESTGVAFPLAHYHNGFGEDSIQAENIAISDFLGGVALLLQATRSIPTSRQQTPGGAQSLYERLRSAPEEEGDRLRSVVRRNG
ncbi:MAG: M28 family peptidase [Chloroflexi bacterium]|nr:M28 family peptidase [Chloroflexota bacterium]